MSTEEPRSPPVFLTTAQFAERYPIGNAPYEAWRAFLERLRDNDDIAEGSHWKWAYSVTSPVRVYHERSVIRIAIEQARDDFAPPFLRNLVCLIHTSKRELQNTQK